MIQMKLFIKQVALDERRRAKQIAAINLQQSRRPPLLSQTSRDVSKNPMATTITQVSDGISSVSEISNSQRVSNISASDFKIFKPMLDIDNLSNVKLLPTKLNNPIRRESKSFKNLLILYFNNYEI